MYVGYILMAGTHMIKQLMYANKLRYFKVWAHETNKTFGILEVVCKIVPE